MKLVLISDTHTMHEDVYLPPGDILIHAGDFTNRGSKSNVDDFFGWLERRSKEYAHIIFIAGNHDMSFEFKPDWFDDTINSLPSNVHYLEDSEIIIGSIKFYGSPWQPEFHNWAFNLPRGKELADKWAMIPNDTDVLITHGPPLYLLDYTIRDGFNVGCKDLYERVLKVKPKLHVFGHIHEGYGVTRHFDTEFVNASVNTALYNPINPPILVDYTTERGVEFL